MVPPPSKSYKDGGEYQVGGKGYGGKLEMKRGDIDVRSGKVR